MSNKNRLIAVHTVVGYDEELGVRTYTRPGEEVKGLSPKEVEQLLDARAIRREGEVVRPKVAQVAMQEDGADHAGGPVDPGTPAGDDGDDGEGNDGDDGFGDDAGKTDPPANDPPAVEPPAPADKPAAKTEAKASGKPKGGSTKPAAGKSK